MLKAVNEVDDIICEIIDESIPDTPMYHLYVSDRKNNTHYDWLYFDLEGAFNHAKENYGCDKSQFKEVPDPTGPYTRHFYEAKAKLADVDVILELQLKHRNHHLIVYDCETGKLLQEHFFQNLKDVFATTHKNFHIKREHFIYKPRIC